MDFLTLFSFSAFSLVTGFFLGYLLMAYRIKDKEQENLLKVERAENDRRLVEEKAEEVIREIKIEMKFSNGIQKNWEQIAKELEFDSVKQMINVHKEDKNWNKYK